MTFAKTILVPTDFGEASEAALDHAVALAKAFDADLVLLYAFEIPVVGFPDGAVIGTADLTSRVVEGAQVGLDRAVRERQAQGVRIRSMLKQGDAWRSVIATVEEIGADLVVMGTHGRRGLPRALIGSVTEKVVRTSPVPVLTVHGGEGARGFAAVDASAAGPASEPSLSAGERTVRTTASARA
jgi:nucleotide-binding universal stress UspA family protein